MEGSQPQTTPSSGPPRSRLAPSASAVDREYDAAVARGQEEEDRQTELNARVAAAREANRAEWNESDAALVAAQHRYAEKVARMPTPEALEEIGSVVGDPLKGPAS